MRIALPSSHREAVSELSYSLIAPKPLCFLSRLHRVFAEFAPVISNKFPVFCYPSFCVFNDTDQIESEEEVGGRTAGPVAELMNGFLHRV